MWLRSGVREGRQRLFDVLQIHAMIHKSVIVFHSLAYSLLEVLDYGQQRDGPGGKCLVFCIPNDREFATEQVSRGGPDEKLTDLLQIMVPAPPRDFVCVAITLH